LISSYIILSHFVHFRNIPSIINEIGGGTMIDPVDPIDYFIFEEVTKDDDEKDDRDDDDDNEDDEW